MEININIDKLFDGSVNSEKLKNEVIEDASEKLVERYAQSFHDYKDKDQILSEAAKVVKERVKLCMSNFAEDFLDEPYIPVDTYGDKAKETTLRQQVIKGVVAQIKFKNSSWSSDKTAFQNIVETTVQEYLKVSKSEIAKVIESVMTNDIASDISDQVVARLRKIR